MILNHKAPPPSPCHIKPQHPLKKLFNHTLIVVGSYGRRKYDLDEHARFVLLLMNKIIHLKKKKKRERPLGKRENNDTAMTTGRQLLLNLR